jgi:DNA-binding transcriptional LysR family regulator
LRRERRDETRSFTYLSTPSAGKSFSQTAVSLGVSQPTVTLRIKEIEDQAGKLLVQRIGQYVTLTEAGEDFLKYVNRILRVLDTGKEIVQRGHTVLPPTIKLAAIPSISSYLLPQFLAHWYKRYPSSSITLCSGHTEDVVHMIHDRIVDIGIVRGTVFDSPLQSIELYHDPICLAVVPGHPLARQENRSISIRQLHREPILIYQSNAWQLVNRVFVSHGIPPRIVAELSHIITVKKLVGSGMGIAFLPYSTIRQELDKGELLMIHVDETTAVHFPTQAVLLERNQSSDPIDKFIAELQTFTRSFPI